MTQPRTRAILGLALGLLMAVLGGCTTSPTVVLSVTPSPSAIDRPVSIRLTGLPADTPVTLAASATDATGRAWHSQAGFTSDAAGTVDTARDRATGQYSGVFADGLIAMMTPVDPVATGALFRPSRSAPIDVAVTAQARGRQVARTILTRSPITGVTPTVTTLAADGFDGVYFSPAGSGTHPAVVLLGGSEGGNSGTLEAELLAAHGIAALSVAYFNPPGRPNAFPGLPKALTQLPLEYFTQPLRWIRRQPGVDDTRVWLSGGSRGSEAALLVGSNFPGLVNGVIATSPTDAVHCALTGSLPQRGDCRHSPWTLAGRPVPYTSQAVTGPTDHPDAVIPVERIRGPVLAVCGEQDLLWDSCPYSEALMARLADHHRPYPRRLLSYPDAGHGVDLLVPLIPYVNQAETLPVYGVTPDANAKADVDAWPRLIAFVAGPS